MNSRGSKSYKSILHAMVLGDGYIYHPKDKGSSYYSLRIRHSAKQEDYLLYKKALLEETLGGHINMVRGIQNNYPFVSFQKSHPYLRFVYQNVYVPNRTITAKALRKLDLQSLCIWYMDDGSLSKKFSRGKPSGYEMRFCLYKSKNEVDLFNEWLLEKYNLHFTAVKGKGQYLSRCGTKEARKVRDLFQPYIIPSMSYKIDLPD